MRIVFANQVRGLAALLVVFNHLVLLYCGRVALIDAKTATPPLPAGPSPPLVDWLAAHLSALAINTGPLGVALFFLLSGLVIPFSLLNQDRGTFLLARGLRIYPTYIAGFCFQLALVLVNASFWGRPYAMSPGELIANCFLVYDWKDGYESFDTVNWTLAIELKFYVLMMLAAGALRRGRTFVLFVTAAALAGILLLNDSDWIDLPDSPLLRIVFLDAPYLIFMFIGVLFNFRIRGLISRWQLLLGTAVLVLAFFVAWRHSASAQVAATVIVNYVYGLAVFATLYALREKIKPNRVLDGLAAISYPLYLVHALTGYSILKYLMIARHWPYGPALVVALCAVLALATLLHYAIEKPTIAAGHWLRRRGPGFTLWRSRAIRTALSLPRRK